jgi:hypothetical protein
MKIKIVLLGYKGGKNGIYKIFVLSMDRYT